jgi:hypothetical protein
VSGINRDAKEQFVNRCSEHLYTACPGSGQVRYVFGGAHGNKVCQSLDEAFLWAVYVNGGYGPDDRQR